MPAGFPVTFFWDGQNRVRDGAELSRFVRECPKLSGFVRKCPRGVTQCPPPERPVPRLVPQIPVGAAPPLSPRPPPRPPDQHADAGPPYPPKNRGPQKIKPTPPENQPTIPSSHQKNIAHPDTILTGRAVKRLKGKPKRRREDTAPGKDKKLRPRLRGWSLPTPNNQYTDIFQTRARRCLTLSSSSVVAISYSAISPASPSGA